MAESLSLNNLFKAGLTREQFLSKYNEMKSSGEGSSSSIFANGMENAVAQIFDVLNTDGNDTLDEAEITKLAAMAENDDTSVLSEADLQVLYNKVAQNIAQTYVSTNPVQMYQNAMQGADPASNTYISDLDIQINTLNDLITARRNNSTTLTTQLQNQIDDIVLKSTKLNNDFKTKYLEASNKSKQLQVKLNENNAKINETKQELANNKNKITLVQREIDSLNPDSDNDKINLRKQELGKLQSNSNDLEYQLTNLSKTDTSLSAELRSTKSLLSRMTSEAASRDIEANARITILKARITTEEGQLANDVQNYESQIQVLQSAKDYAITQISVAQSEGDFASHNNDNALNMDELSKMGLKYSSEKGQKLAQTVGSHATGFKGYCSRYVSNALAESGLGKERMPSAHMMDTALENNKNFQKIQVHSQEELRSLPAGCIVVYEAGAAGYNAKHGHIEVTLGNGTAASDGITRNQRYTENMTVFVPVERA